MYRHSFVVIVKNEELGTSRIVPLFSAEYPFIITKVVRSELESLALSSTPFIKLLDDLKEQDYFVSSSLWNIELINKNSNETSSQENK